MQTTLRYAHLMPEHLRDSMTALDAAILDMNTSKDTKGKSKQAAAEGNPQQATFQRVTNVGR